MRRLIPLFACAFIFSEALANDAPAASTAAASTVESPKADTTKEIAKPTAKKPEAAEPVLTKAEKAERDLAAKIAARLAAMRAARAAKVAEAIKLSKIKESTASAAHGTPPVVIAPPDPHWSYEGEGGPDSWGKLSPAWAKCDSGKRQSPIDIRDGIKVNLEAIKFDYKPTTYSVIDNGHTVQVNINNGSAIRVMGRVYELVQFHFHRPAEERVNGRGFVMVAHLVHKDMDGKLAVVAVMIEQGKGNDALQTVWNNLPLEKNDALAVSAPLDILQLLPTRREYYTYMGSLTTPPCSEGVLWMVMKEPLEASADQIAVFARLYPMNARPLQGASGRMIKESN